MFPRLHLRCIILVDDMSETDLASRQRYASTLGSQISSVHRGLPPYLLELGSRVHV